MGKHEHVTNTYRWRYLKASNGTSGRLLDFFKTYFLTNVCIDPWAVTNIFKYVLTTSGNTNMLEQIPLRPQTSLAICYICFLLKTCFPMFEQVSGR